MVFRAWLLSSKSEINETSSHANVCRTGSVVIGLDPELIMLRLKLVGT